MTIRLVTGYVAHALLGIYLLWMIGSNAPRLRPAQRDRPRRVKILLIKTAAVVVAALLVGVIHYWATEWWHVVAALVGSSVIGLYLHRSYRKLVSPPRHRIALVHRGATSRVLVSPASLANRHRHRRQDPPRTKI